VLNRELQKKIFAGTFISTIPANVYSIEVASADNLPPTGMLLLNGGIGPANTPSGYAGGITYPFGDQLPDGGYRFCICIAPLTFADPRALDMTIYHEFVHGSGIYKGYGNPNFYEEELQTYEAELQFLSNNS